MGSEQLDYARALRDHLTACRRERKRILLKLRSPAYLISRGLPAEMPESSLQILADVHVQDKLGPRRPKRPIPG